MKDTYTSFQVIYLLEKARRETCAMEWITLLFCGEQIYANLPPEAKGAKRLKKVVDSSSFPEGNM